ncbi:MAG: hypothetical protein AAF127_09080 [Pseudomonadota bacterium]
MTDTKKSDKSEPKATFHYIKAGEFRTVHVDGAIGSLTPSGHIHCAIYSERPAIPRIVSNRLDENGALIDGGENVIDGKSGFVRELQADLVLTPEVASALAQWLNSLLENMPVESSEGETLQ